MVKINFKCKNCKEEFDCEVGEVNFPKNINDRLKFEKEVICPNCNEIKVEEAELTELGQTQVTELDFSRKENFINKTILEKRFKASIPRHMYWSSELKEWKRCPKCKLQLKKEYHVYFIATNVDGKRDAFASGTDGGYFCPKCPLIVLDTEEFGEMMLAAGVDSFCITGIVDFEAIQKDRKHVLLGSDDNPLPVVEFINFSDKEKHENFITDESVFNVVKRGYTQERKRKLGRNEPCHCGSGKKYKKCCLDKDIKKYGSAIKI